LDPASRRNGGISLGCSITQASNFIGQEAHRIDSHFPLFPKRHHPRFAHLTPHQHQQSSSSSQSRPRQNEASFSLDKVSIRLAAASNVVYLIVQKEALPTTIPYIPHTHTSHTQPDSCFSALTPEPGTLEVLPFHPKAATSQPQIGQSTFI
jgi:hypothetical protein